MSYSVNEGLDDAKRRVRALKAIAERHPNATMDGLPNGDREWTDPELKTADRVHAMADKDGAIWLVAYVLVEGMPVYVNHWKWERVETVLDRLQKLKDGSYEAFVGLVLDRKPTKAGGGAP